MSSGTRGLVKVGKHLLRSRRIVRPYPNEAAERIDKFFRERTWRFVSHIPTALWNDLLDGLSRCDCGRMIAPQRARQKRAITAETCSTRCAKLRTMRERRANERAGIVAPKPNDSLHALNEALYQTESTE